MKAEVGRLDPPQLLSEERMPKAHIHGLTISFAVSMAWGMASIIALAPIMLALGVTVDTTISTLMAITIFIASTAFLIGYMHSITKQIEFNKVALREIINARIREREEPESDTPAVSRGKEIISIANEDSVKAPLPKGLSKYHLLALLDSIESRQMDAISARSVDAVGILSRDPMVKPNATDLVKWLANPLYGMTESMGNSRYKLTRVGENTLKSLRQPPPLRQPTPA